MNEKIPSVLFYCQQFRPVVGGAERHAEKLARALVRKGCRVEILTPQTDPSWPVFEEIDGVVIRRFALHTRHPLFSVFKGSGLIHSYMKIRAAVEEHLPRFDILQIFIATIPAAMVVASAMRFKKPILCKIACGGECFDFNSMRKKPLIGAAAVKFIKRYISAWVVPSLELEHTLAQEGIDKDKVRRINHGVECGRPASKKNDPARNFLYLGRLTNNPTRDFHTVVEAFRGLLSQVDGCRLKFVGGGERLEELSELIGSYPGLDKHIQAVGFSDPVRWLDWADALIHPSLAEGMSNSLLEAMAAGLACVANDISPNREALDNGNAGMLVRPGDAVQLKSALLRLAGIEGEGSRFSNAARQRVEREYDISATCGQYIQFYQELIGK